MRVLSANIDNLTSRRSRGKDRCGFFELEHVLAADVLCLQETNVANAKEIGEALGFSVIAAERPQSATKKGGVAIFSRLPIEDPVNSDGTVLEPLGQFVACTIGTVRIASVYVTHHGSDQFDEFDRRFAEMARASEHALIAGDMNIFRDARDSWRFSEAMKKPDYEPGCDPTRQKWFKRLFETGWTDILWRHCDVRPLHTWWAGQKFYADSNGTRLDYLLASKALAERATIGSGNVYSEIRYGKHAQIGCSFIVE